MDVVVGLDVATADVRAMAVDATGGVHAEASVPLPEPVSRRPGWVEQDAAGWWPAVVSVLKEVSAALDQASGSVVACRLVCDVGDRGCPR